MKKISKKSLKMILAGILAGTFVFCGFGTFVIPAAEKNVSEKVEKAADEIETKTDTKSDSKENLVGEWIYAYSISHSKSGEEEWGYFDLAADYEYVEGIYRIRQENGKYIADHKYEGMESLTKIIGAELKMSTGAAYDECDNKEWYAELTDPFEDEEDDNYKERLTLSKDGRLLDISLYHEDATEESEEYDSQYITVYLRSDDPLLKNPDDLRYFDTVEVSDATELLNALKDNTKVILNEGEYDFTKVDDEDIENENITSDYRDCVIKGVSNLCIEAKEGADVLLSVDEAYEPVMSFEEGDHITIRNVTAGHNVEPGYCSGSVFSFNNISELKVDGCHLYGCGTYGIEGVSLYNSEITDTEIYECTYGLVDLRDAGSITFNNCEMRDSEDMSMICLSNVYNILFENCKFHDNNSMSYDTCSFVSLGDDDAESVTFRKCEFKDNEYYTFSNLEVTLEDCKSDNNKAAYQDAMDRTVKNVYTKDGVLEAYDEAMERQEEIDDQFEEGMLDQLSLNKLAAEELDMWDGLLEGLLGYLETSLSEDEMDSLQTKQSKWIINRENAIKDATEGFEGGTMLPMVENGTAASVTKDRVTELINKYLK
ncbi:MAG: right-handed parallel beta-helix repeat-containing protein [Lachnospiraceae bacterium]|nr:right-handed parallel beta-helix repeat-containing protein [Lachnospiraceae bacterium]